MARAIELAQTSGVPLGPNPRVGCVLLDPSGEPVAEGFHRGAGQPHAEVEALRAAAGRTRGATAVVTLEPCHHHGRTGPCTEALVEAGVARVVFAQADPNPVAAGGAAALASAGVDVVGGLLEQQARAVNPEWSLAVERGRPFVTWKLATTLDGRSAAADGTSRWISSVAARRDTHRLRSRSDVILAGTGTVLVDDPQLTVRDEEDVPMPRDRAPLRAVMGLRDLPADRRVLDDTAETTMLRTREPVEALEQLFALDRQRVFLEGGPTLAAAFLTAGLVDEVVAYVAPMFLGSGLSSVGDLGIETMADASRWTLKDVSTVGIGEDRNVRLVLAPPVPSSPPSDTTCSTRGK